MCLFFFPLKHLNPAGTTLCAAEFEPGRQKDNCVESIGYDVQNVAPGLAASGSPGNWLEMKPTLDQVGNSGGEGGAAVGNFTQTL